MAAAMQFRHNSGHDKLYIAYGDASPDVLHGREFAGKLERKGYGCILRDRDTVPGNYRYMDSRTFIPQCSLVIGLVTENFVKDPYLWTQYEVALSMDYNRDIILVPINDVKIPELFCCLSKSQPFKSEHKWWEHFLCSVDVMRRARHSKQPHIKSDLIKEFIWSREQRAHLDTDEANMNMCRVYMQENKVLQRRIHMLIELRATESAALTDQIRRLETETCRLLSTKSSTRDIQQEIAIKKRENAELSSQLDVSRKKLEEFILSANDTKPAQTAVTPSTGTRVEESLYKMILELSLHHQSHKNHIEEDLKHDRVPSDVKAFCNRYQGIIAPDQVMSCGQELGLDPVRLDKVASFREYGTEKMFCQLIYEYFKASNGEVQINKLLDCLRETGVNLEGKPMPQEHLTVLTRNMSYLYDNVLDIAVIAICLIQEDKMSLTTAQYILQTPTRTTRLLRLIDYLKTRDTGFRELLAALTEAGLDHVTRRLSAQNGSNEVHSKNPAENLEENSILLYMEQEGHSFNGSTSMTVSDQQEGQETVIW